jgi:hypothetical protein
MEGDVSDESEKRRRRPRFNSTAPSTRALTEDEQFAAAIAASMAGYEETSNGGSSSRAEVKVHAGTRSIPRRGDLEEDRQLEAALLASMAGADISGEEDDDAPTVDELRKRRLARFG